jgi:glyoxylase-like metal-dependent hydrolase (beta-lactamase superfamily II)
MKLIPLPAFQELQSQGLQLEAILVTHHHADHIGGVDEGDSLTVHGKLKFTKALEPDNPEPPVRWRCSPRCVNGRMNSNEAVPTGRHGGDAVAGRLRLDLTVDGAGHLWHARNGNRHGDRSRRRSRR